MENSAEAVQTKNSESLNLLALLGPEGDERNPEPMICGRTLGLFLINGV